MPRKGGKRKKTKTHEAPAPEGATRLLDKNEPEPPKDDIPRSIVAKSGNVVHFVKELVRDLRKVMEPFTASNLREKAFNRIKDYVAVAGQLAITHLLVISQSEKNVLLRLCKCLDGPTLYFKITQYSLARQVRALQKRPYESPASYLTPPLVVLNNFGQTEESHVKLMRLTFQNMFPTINVKTVKLSDCRRVVLFHLNKAEGTVEMRHYAIRAAPVGVSKSVKKVLQSKVPDLSKLQDVSEFIENSASFGSGMLSDSEAEDDNSKVTLPDRYIGKGNAKAQLSAMKLSELGPRITLELFKVVQGLNEGDILYHKYVQKTPEEAAAIKRKVDTERALKVQRKAVQNANVKRKREAEEEAKAAKREQKRVKYENKDREQQLQQQLQRGGGGGGSDSGSDRDDGDGKRGAKVSMNRNHNNNNSSSSSSNSNSSSRKDRDGDAAGAEYESEGEMGDDEDED